MKAVWRLSDRTFGGEALFLASRVRYHEATLDGGWKICALCRHLEVVEEGREFPRIADTEYVVFRCRVLGWTVREDYLMAPVEKELREPPPFDCPYWEIWSEPAPVEE